MHNASCGVSCICSGTWSWRRWATFRRGIDGQITGWWFSRCSRGMVAKAGPSAKGPTSGVTHAQWGDSTSPQQTMQGGLRLGPPERWWDNKKFAKSLGLRAEQKEKMDDIFNANKGTTLLRYQSFVQEQSRMEQLSKQTMPDEAVLSRRLIEWPRRGPRLRKPMRTCFCCFVRRRNNENCSSQ